MPRNLSLSESEFKLMIELLKKYAENEMDQWEMWRLDSKKLGGPVCFKITLGPEPGYKLSNYDDLARLIE